MDPTDYPAQYIYLKKCSLKLLMNQTQIMILIFFYGKTDIQFMELAAIKIIECIKNPYLAFVWPSANKKDFNEEKLIPNIIYKKNLNFNQSAAKIFLGQIYRNSKWIGNSENKFKGIEKTFRMF